MLKNNKTIIDDGFKAALVKGARFEGCMEIPCIEKPDKIVIPHRITPFSKRNSFADVGDFIAFYEQDIVFQNCIIAIDDYIDELALHEGVISPDCSVYYDMPFCTQIANIYMNRAIGYYLQSKGIYVIPNVRWGDERTYTTAVIPEKAAFLGVPKHSIVAIGTYGCSKTKEEKLHLRNGLIAMLDELEPEIVLVYGAMTKSVFEGLENRTKFIHYPDYITLKKRGVA